MNEVTVKSGKGELRLQKSERLVGLKSRDRKALLNEPFVQAEFIPNLGGFQVVTLEQTPEDSVDTKLDEARSQEAVQIGTHVYFAEGDNRPIVPTGELFLTFQEGVSEEEQQTLLEEFHLELLERRPEGLLIVRVTDRSPNPLKVAHSLQQLRMVTSAEPDLDMIVDEYAALSLTDDLIPHQWHLENNGFVVDVNFALKKGADARVTDAWKRLGNAGSAEVTVALIDNGFDTSHPDLAPKIVRPYSVKNRSNAIDQGDPRFTHGTPCASVAIAAANGNGLVGAAPSARFMPVDGTSFSTRETEEMFDYCVRNGADIISCSWGTTDSRYSLNTLKEQALIRAATEGRNGKGCVVVFAVGNENLNYINFYAAVPGVIAVAASTSQDTHASYSNRGREVSVCAPSNGHWPIIAARAWWDPGITNEDGQFRFWRDGRSRGDRYKHFGGTSSSTPLVAGICALILSANPDLTAAEVKEVLESTADKIGHPSEYVNGHSPKFGYGRVNADRAVAEAIRRRDSTSATQPASPIETIITGGEGLFRFNVQKQAASGWSVQIGAFYDYGNVLIQTEKLQRLFDTPVIVNINELNGRTIYKVLLGAFADPQAARELLAQVRASGYEPFLRNLQDFQGVVTN